MVLYSRPSLRMDMAAVPVAVTRSVSAGVVFLEYCLTLWSNLSVKVMWVSKWDYGSPEIWFSSKYRFKKDLGVAKWVVPNLYLWPASKLSCLHTFKSVIVALVCLKQDKYINLRIFWIGLLLYQCFYKKVALVSCVLVAAVFMSIFPTKLRLLRTGALWKHLFMIQLFIIIPDILLWRFW